MHRTTFAILCAAAFAIAGPLARAEAAPALEFDELDNSINGMAEAGPSPQVVVRSGCIGPFGRVRIGVALFGKGVFRFVTTPSRFFDVVMKLDFPGFHRTVDNFFAGGIERIDVRKNVAPRINGTVTISGFRGSFGCFVFRLTP
jgi:hypothetical protein